MSEQLGPMDAPSLDVTPTQPAPPSDHLSELDGLLHQLKEESSAPRQPLESRIAADNELAIVRLGIAGSLFTALRCKNAATAQHSLRVALTSSAWALHMKLPDRDRDEIEVAALLHDVGMIGLPDKVIFKRGELNDSESHAVLRARRLSVEILRTSCRDSNVLRIVDDVGAWYDGSRTGFRNTGELIPFGARLISIVEAFDAMTTSNRYRPARTHERAMSELFACASTQFDPELVARFDEFFHGDMASIHSEVSKRWLRHLDPKMVNSYWELQALSESTTTPSLESPFLAKMFADTQDAVIFLDRDQRVMRWNHGAEQLTGIPATSMLQRQNLCDALKLFDEHDVRLDCDKCEECPIGCAFNAGVSSVRRLKLVRRQSEDVPLNCHAIPVKDDDGERLGVVVILRDVSTQTTWEERCQNLVEKTKLDPLTRLTNRAEFDQVHEVFINTHRAQDLPCSLIICDIDHFKHVNDTYGHQAGDEVIRTLSGLLKDAARAGDVAARYGGEEFVVLFADCDAAGATARAEQIRKKFSEITHPELNGQAVTASFGVTEAQPGDTAETMLRRADRGLLTAKSKGRNMVVQLGSGRDTDTSFQFGGLDDAPDAPKQRDDTALQQDLFTPAPLSVVLEKLRGFVADHQARIVQTDLKANMVWMTVAHRKTPGRRRGDRPMEFRVVLELSEDVTPPDSEGAATPNCTQVRVTISRSPGRNRRRSDQSERGQQILTSLRCYLVASSVGAVQFTDIPEFPEVRGLAAWLFGKKRLGGRRRDNG